MSAQTRVRSRRLPAEYQIRYRVSVRIHVVAAREEQRTQRGARIELQEFIPAAGRLAASGELLTSSGKTEGD